MVERRCASSIACEPWNVARDDAVGEQLMRTDELLAAVDRTHHHPAIAIGLVVEIGMGRQQAF